jgi:hypothetical protein
MIEYERVRPEGCNCELCSDILQNCKDMRNKFECTTLAKIPPSLMGGIKRGDTS